MKTSAVSRWHDGRGALVTTDDGEVLNVVIERGAYKRMVFGEPTYKWHARVKSAGPRGWEWTGAVFKSDSFQVIAKRAAHARLLT